MVLVCVQRKLGSSKEFFRVIIGRKVDVLKVQWWTVKAIFCHLRHVTKRNFVTKVRSRLHAPRVRNKFVISPFYSRVFRCRRHVIIRTNLRLKYLCHPTDLARYAGACDAEKHMQFNPTPATHEGRSRSPSSSPFLLSTTTLLLPLKKNPIFCWLYVLLLLYANNNNEIGTTTTTTIIAKNNYKRKRKEHSPPHQHVIIYSLYYNIHYAILYRIYNTLYYLYHYYYYLKLMIIYY